MITCCYALALHLYYLVLKHALASLLKVFAVPQHCPTCFLGYSMIILWSSSTIDNDDDNNNNNNLNLQNNFQNNNSNNNSSSSSNKKNIN